MAPKDVQAREKALSTQNRLGPLVNRTGTLEAQVAALQSQVATLQAEAAAARTHGNSAGVAQHSGIGTVTGTVTAAEFNALNTAYNQAVPYLNAVASAVQSL